MQRKNWLITKIISAVTLPVELFCISLGSLVQERFPWLENASGACYHRLNWIVSWRSRLMYVHTESQYHYSNDYHHLWTVTTCIQIANIQHDASALLMAERLSTNTARCRARTRQKLVLVQRGHNHLESSLTHFIPII